MGLNHFADEYYLQGPPKDYSSELVIYDHGVEVKSGTVHVNSPLSYKGVSFHQAFFGQTTVMEVKDASGSSIFSAGVPLAWQSLDGGRPIGSFTLPAQHETVYVTGPATGETDPLIPAGEMKVEVYESGGALVSSANVTQGVAQNLAGLTFTFVRESRFTGLKVVKDPGVNLIWIAAILMVIGLVMLFYFPTKRIWAICKPRPDGTADVLLATTAERDLSQTRDFENMRERVKLALGISGEAMTGRREANMYELSQYSFVAAFAALALAVCLYVVNIVGARGISRMSLANGGSVSTSSLGPTLDAAGRYATILTVNSFAFLSACLVFRAIASGHGPFSNMYEFSLAFGWGGPWPSTYTSRSSTGCAVSLFLCCPWRWA